MKIASVLLLTLLVCILAMVESEEEMSKVPFPRRCPPGWTRYRRKCFQFHLDTKSWASAEEFCLRARGHLASYHSQREYQFLRDLVLKAAGFHKRTWVGGNDAVREGLWMWSDGSFFNFANWGSGEPNNLGGNENCMEINLRGTDYVNDVDCSIRSSFICSRKF